MRQFQQRAVLLGTAVIIAVSLLVGCGGGGGGGGGSTANFIITGTVQDFSTKVGIPGVVVRIDTRSATTDASGRYRIEFQTAPSVAEWVVTAPTTHFNYWCKLDLITQPYDPRHLPMPAVTEKNTIMPTVNLLKKDPSQPPPPPP